MTAKLTGELEPTATFKARDWAWVPLPEIGGGLLTVVTRRPRAGDAEDIYLVRADGDGFLLHNRRKDVTYRCVPAGLLAGCSCPAGQYRGACKHRDCLAAIFGGTGQSSDLDRLGG
jgi:hypothetical protein